MGLFGKPVPKAKKKVFKILRKEWLYFLRLHVIVIDLHLLVGSELMGDLANYRRNPKGVLKKMDNYLKQLKRFETREQWRASVSKLKDAMDELLKLPLLDANAKDRIVPLVDKMKVFEGDLLKETVEELGKKLDMKMPSQISWWQEIREITTKLIQDLKALTALDKELKKLVKG